MKGTSLWIVVCADLHRHLRAANLSRTEYEYTGVLPYTFSVLDAALSLENMVIVAEALGLGSVIIGSIIDHPEKTREILELPAHCLALSILCVGHAKSKGETRPKWDYRVMVCEDSYKDIDVKDIAEYWRKFVSGNFKRGGKTMSDEELEKFCIESPYGKTYAQHYTEEFVRTTNAKLLEYLRKQGLL
jgi:FMN reductase (NADPH)